MTERGLSVVTPNVTNMLTDAEIAVLDFERSWWKFAGAKEQEIRTRFNTSATRYYQQLNALIDRPEALAHDPMLVRRLLRLRDARRGGRVGMPTNAPFRVV